MSELRNVEIAWYEGSYQITNRKTDFVSKKRAFEIALQGIRGILKHRTRSASNVDTIWAEIKQDGTRLYSISSKNDQGTSFKISRFEDNRIANSWTHNSKG